MIPLGMPTLIESPAPAECAALCHALGLSFIELNMNLPQYQPGSVDVAQCVRLAAEYGIYYTIHLDENLNASDFNPYVAEAYKRTALEAIALAKRLQAPVLNMHLPRGVHFTLPDKKIYLFEAYRERYLQMIADFRDACTAAAGDAGITICVENTDGYLPFQRSALKLLLESSVFGLTLDVGHSHSAGKVDEPLILQTPGALRHMHLHDALGQTNHLIPGTGEIDLPRYAALAEQRGCRVVLETKTCAALRAAVAWMRRSQM